MKLFILRQKIQKVDREIISLLKKRFILSREIARVKERNDLSIKNSEVESNILLKYCDYAENIASFIKEIYKEIFRQSRAFQRYKTDK